MPDPHGHRRVLVVGGGFAALEALIALRSLAGARVALELIAPDREFTNRPAAPAAAFGRDPTPALALADVAATLGAELVAETAVSVDSAENRVLVSGGEVRAYDKLLMAPGARTEDAVPGAITFGTPAGTARFGALLADAEAGRVAELIFAVPAGSDWPLALYELAMLTAERLRAAGAPTAIRLLTPEPAPLAKFGGRASGAVLEDLEDRGIHFIAGVCPDEVAWGELRASPGNVRLSADAVVTLPRLTGPRVPGLPSDEHGFIPVDAHGRVRGTSDVYAAGDAINFPIKLGGLAVQQADAAAEAIAASVGAAVVPEPFRPVLRGMLLTGGGGRYLEGVAPGGEGGTASIEPLWWPPAKVAGRYLAPFLRWQVPSAPNPTEGVDVNIKFPEWPRLTRIEG